MAAGGGELHVSRGLARARGGRAGPGGANETRAVRGSKLAAGGNRPPQVVRGSDRLSSGSLPTAVQLLTAVRAAWGLVRGSSGGPLALPFPVGDGRVAGVLRQAARPSPHAGEGGEAAGAGPTPRGHG